MANNSDDFRRLMNLMESFQEPVLLEGWVDRLAGIFNGKSMGAHERSQMAKELVAEWNKWLGQTDRTGDLEDMIRFMKMRVGFNDTDIGIVLDRAGIVINGDEGEADDAEADSSDDTPDAPQAGKADADSEDDDALDLDGGYDPEEGIPLPTDLNAKLNDYKTGKLGGQTKAPSAASAKSTPAKDAGKVVVDDPKKYILPSGDYDRDKARRRLHSLPKGTTLKIGDRSYRLTVGDEGEDFFKGSTEDSQEQHLKANQANQRRVESINEDTMQLSDHLDRKSIKLIMDFVAAQVNDEYILNGPERDKDISYGGYGTRANWNRNYNTMRSNYQRGGPQDPDNADNRGPDAPEIGGRGSGKYDSQMMKNVLKRELEVSDASQQSIAQKVKQQDHNGMAHMMQSDMEILAKIGYAFLKAK